MIVYPVTHATMPQIRRYRAQVRSLYASISEYASPRGSGRSEHEVKAHPRNVGIFNHRITVDDKKKVPQSRDRSVLGSSPDNFGMEIKLFISVSGAAPDSKPHSHEDRSSFVSFQAGH